MCKHVFSTNVLKKYTQASTELIITMYSSFLCSLSIGSLSHQIPFMLSIFLTRVLAIKSPRPPGRWAPAGSDRKGYSFSDTMKQIENPAQMQGNRQVGELGKFTNRSAHGIVS